jgi:protein involved in polysaccharide export with SLBB domain
MPARQWCLLAVAFGCVLLCTACSNSPPAPSRPGPSTPTVQAAYRLGSGDKLRVTVYNEKSLSGDYEVSDQGVLAMPLIGSVTVGNLTTHDAEALLTEKLAKYLVDPHVGIEVLNYRPFFILGEVQKPGSYPYVSGMTVLNAVSLGGGFTPRADEHDITIKHASDPDTAAQKVDEDATVSPGDILRVHERIF